MKRLNLVSAFLLSLFACTLNSCEAIAGIFKAGMGFGIFIAVLIIAIIIYIVIKLGKGKSS
jgi:hypothetical protein